MIEQPETPFLFLAFCVMSTSVGLFGLLWGLAKRGTRREREEKASELAEIQAGYARWESRHSNVCAWCKKYWLPWWTHPCSHAKRDSLMVPDGEWPGVDAWLEAWRGKPWSKR